MATLILGAGLRTAAAQSAADQPAYSERDLFCLAQNVYYEARNQPRKGQLAVAYVTLHRLAASRTGATICDVVYKSGHFSWTKDRRKLHRTPPNTRAWRIAQGIAQQAVTDSDDDPVRGCTFFHAASIEPDWAQSMIRVARIGDHVFYRSPGSRTTQ